MVKDLPTWEKFQKDLLKDVKDSEQKRQMSKVCKKAKNLFETLSDAERSYLMKNNYTGLFFRSMS